MNYRHSFHAGNFADVLKHIVLVQIIKLLKKKDKPFMVLDAFSGTGIYDLHDETAARNPEYLDGIIKIWDFAQNNNNLSEAIKDYIDVLAKISDSQRYYAGSPFIIAQMLRTQDRVFFNELHKVDNQILFDNLKEFKRVCECKSIHVENSDGYLLVKSKMPPSEKRGLVFIDPPFEKPDEFKNMINATKEGLKRFETGVFALWYADKNATQTRDFLKKLKNLDAKYLNVSMQVQNKNEIKGLVSAGLFIINPPYGLFDTLSNCLGQLTKILGKNEGAKFTLEGSQSI